MIIPAGLRGPIVCSETLVNWSDASLPNNRVDIQTVKGEDFCEYSRTTPFIMLDNK